MLAAENVQALVNVLVVECLYCCKIFVYFFKGCIGVVGQRAKVVSPVGMARFEFGAQ